MGVWIEIQYFPHKSQAPSVTPFVGVWIEITIQSIICIGHLVTPFVGVWIEIVGTISYQSTMGVTPFVGVWIEIDSLNENLGSAESLPSWECGLKSMRLLVLSMSVRRHSLRGSVD